MDPKDTKIQKNSKGKKDMKCFLMLEIKKKQPSTTVTTLLTSSS